MLFIERVNNKKYLHFDFFNYDYNNAKKNDTKRM